MNKGIQVNWTLVIVGCCFVFSWLSANSTVAGWMEVAFNQQLVELLPAIKLPAHAGPPPSYAIKNLVLITVFSLMILYLAILKKSKFSVIFTIQLVFSLFMLQLLFEVMLQIWLPTIWAIVCFVFTALLLMMLSKFIGLKKKQTFFREKRLNAIKQKIKEGNFEKAVLMLKSCQFSEEMFDIGYDLGLKLEQQENWILARYLYSWLSCFDPGIQDFVTRMDHKINPHMEADLSTSEITQNKDQFGHYQLLGKKAIGSTATVYEAFDLLTHKRIALKILNPVESDEQVEQTTTGELTDEGLNDQGVLSFLHEAMTVSKLDHPNIVKIHDADIHNEQTYIAMDYIAGYPMSERLRRRKYLTAAESLRVMQSVLNGLALAHSKGVIHGDIKPANIMYDQHKKIYILTDFGAANSGSRLRDNGKTIMGTPAYMSPEQLSGVKMDGRSDIFSLAVTIYHLLSGVQPFTGDTLPELKMNVLKQSLDMSVLNVPDAIRQVLEKALQKKTYQRFADASQMLQAVNYCEQKMKENKK